MEEFLLCAFLNRARSQRGAEQAMIKQKKILLKVTLTAHKVSTENHYVCVCVYISPSLDCSFYKHGTRIPEVSKVK